MLTALVSQLFVVIDPIGSIPIFLAVLKGMRTQRAQTVILREMLIALAIMLAFAFCGEYLLSALGIDPRSLGVSGGIILFVMALKMLFPQQQEQLVEVEDAEPFIFPLAFPLIAGPSVLAVLVAMSRERPQQQVCMALVLTWVLSTVILLFAAGSLKAYLKDQSMTACERIMGLVLLLFATQMMLGGITSYYQLDNLHPFTPQIK